MGGQDRRAARAGQRNPGRRLTARQCIKASLATLARPGYCRETRTAPATGPCPNAVLRSPTPPLATRLPPRRNSGPLAGSEARRPGLRCAERGHTRSAAPWRGPAFIPRRNFSAAGPKHAVCAASRARADASHHRSPTQAASPRAGCIGPGDRHSCVSEAVTLATSTLSSRTAALRHHQPRDRPETPNSANAACGAVRGDCSLPQSRICGSERGPSDRVKASPSGGIGQPWPSPPSACSTREVAAASKRRSELKQKSSTASGRLVDRTKGTSACAGSDEMTLRLAKQQPGDRGRGDPRYVPCLRKT